MKVIKTISGECCEVCDMRALANEPLDEEVDDFEEMEDDADL